MGYTSILWIKIWRDFEGIITILPSMSLLKQDSAMELSGKALSSLFNRAMCLLRRPQRLTSTGFSPCHNGQNMA